MTVQLPKQHPRAVPTNQAHTEMSSELLRISAKYNLTFAEQCLILSSMLENAMQFAVRDERKHSRS
jgi:hypothetical protein